MASETFGGLDAALASARVPALGRSTARGWGSTGRGLCVLHEPPTPIQYTRRSCSGAPPSRSGHWAEGGIESVVPWRRSRPRRPPSRSYLMPRVRGFKVRTGDLPYEREALTQGRARRPGLNWLGVVRTARSPGKPPTSVSDVMTSETLRSEETARCNETTR